VDRNRCFSLICRNHLLTQPIFRALSVPQPAAQPQAPNITASQPVTCAFCCPDAAAAAAAAWVMLLCTLMTQASWIIALGWHLHVEHPSVRPQGAQPFQITKLIELDKWLD
jgi:hypothetical protein